MNPTKNDIPKSAREKVAALLNARLADTADLAYQAKQAHWNVKGPHFEELHELFDEVYTGVQGYADEIAERAVQLGGQVHGTVRAAAKNSSLPEYPLNITGGLDHAEALSDVLAAYGKRIRKDIDKADAWGDPGTADLLTEISQGIDKFLWMVEAHLQDDKKK